MDTTETMVGKKLVESFARFRRMRWKHNLVEGLTRNEVAILTYIKDAVEQDPEGIKVSELSSILNVASPTMTQQINSLEAQGFVERSIDKEDRRAVRIRLTERGMCVQEKAAEAFLAAMHGLVEYLGEEDSNKLADLMAKVATYFTEVRSVDL